MINSGALKGNLIYVSLGSNLGNKLQNLDIARELIGNEVGNMHSVSGIYESAAWGYSSENLFYNCCLSSVTLLEPLPLLEKMLSIETKMGRVRGDKGYSDRLIDMDLLFFNNVVLDHPRLVIPHPAMANRRFVLTPLSEIAPELVHPVNGLTVLEMLEGCQDKVAVKLIG